MELRPTTRVHSPKYPAHSPRLRRFLVRARRAAIAATASIALSLSACYGSTRLDPIDVGGDADVVVTTDAGDSGTDGDISDATIPPDDATTITRSITWCEPDHRLAGEESTPSLYFSCGTNMPADTPTSTAPTWLMDGQLCGHQTAWTQVQVDEPFAGALTFPYGTEFASLSLYAPDGSLALELNPDRPCAAFDIEAGLWTLAVDAVDPEGAGDAYFTLAFDQYYEPEW